MNSGATENQQPMRQIKHLCVFCGSSTGVRAAYAQAAALLGRELANSRVALVFGGGRVGLMGVLADSVLGAGGQAIGVMPRSLVEKEIAHTSLTELHVVESMHQRKALMAGLSDAFLLLPGGFGSWEEFCEIVTWLQLGIHRKPCAILNVAGYYSGLLSLADRALAEGFLRPAYHKMLIVEDDPQAVLLQLARVSIPSEVKWVSEPER